MNESQAVVVQPQQVQSTALTVMEVKHQVTIVRDIMKQIMQDKVHFGTIPGCPKPSLYQPGAELLKMAFRLSDQYEVEFRDLGNGHREYTAKCTIRNMATGTIVSESYGTCSTMESKYRYRKAEQKCPECGQATIIKGKKEYGGGWLCFKKKGGCGAKFKDGDTAIDNQEMGRVEYEDPADYYNTCCKMAQKRAMVSGVRGATSASDVFAVDVEDNPTLYGYGEPAEQDQPPAPPEVQDDGYDKKRLEIRGWLLEMVQGDVVEAGKMLAKYLKIVKADQSTKSTKSLTPESCDAVYDTLYHDFNEFMLAQPRDGEPASIGDIAGPDAVDLFDQSNIGKDKV